MNQPIKISVLLVEDDRIDTMAFKREVAEKNLPYNYLIATSLQESHNLLKVQGFDIAILDYRLGDGTCEELLPILEEKGIPAVVATGSGNEETAAMIVRQGAYDYLIKDPDRNYLKVLPPTIENALTHKRSLQQTQLLTHAISNALDCIFIVDITGKLLFVNRSFCGLSKPGMCTPGEDLDEIGPPIMAKETFKFISESNSIESKQVEIELTEDDDQLVYFSLSFNVASNPFAEGKIVIAVARNITQQKITELELRKANNQLELLSNLDGLTQIANRRCFDVRLQNEWYRSQRQFKPISLIILDVDYFKLYNDYYGHLAGDDCLVQIAKTMQQIICRSTDLLARYGGEEFAIILPNTNLEGAVYVAGKLKLAISNLQIPHVKSHLKPIVTISMGIASIIPTQEVEAKELIDRADKELYYAKQQGRDRISAHSFNCE